MKIKIVFDLNREDCKNLLSAIVYSELGYGGIKNKTKDKNQK